jgi:hypothetical protein
MSEIFLSWTSANREAVKPLAAELKNLGFDLYEYEEDMQLGGDISVGVRAEIKKARLALLCFDDSTYDRQWILNELAWSVAAIQDGTMQGIIPVWVGPHPANKLPELIDKKYPAFDLETRTHDKVLDLASRIVRFLPNDTRHVVYGAVYSMNAEQFAKVHATDPVVGGLKFSEYLDKVCRQLGMAKKEPPTLLDLLAKRYGATADDVKPFENGPSIMTLIYENLGQVNAKRSERPGAKQLFIRWVREELNGKSGVEERDRVSARWSTGDSLLVLDSLSLWCNDVRNEFLNAAPEISTSSIVWIPPFTQQTGALYQTLDQSWSIISRLRDEFQKWSKDPNRNVTCEASTAFALGRWLHRTLASVQGQVNPLADNLSQLEPGPPISTSHFFPT